MSTTLLFRDNAFLREAGVDGVGDRDRAAVLPHDPAAVAGLAAALGVEHGPVEDHR
jgi:hypothetical protein